MSKFVGQTSTFEELLAQARFEEARQKNLPPSQNSTSPYRRKDYDVAKPVNGISKLDKCSAHQEMENGASHVAELDILPKNERKRCSS